MKMKKWWLSFAVIFNVLSSSGQQTFKEVVRTPDHLGGILLFCIDYTCSFHVDNCCGLRCVIDGTICTCGDPFQDTCNCAGCPERSTFHVEYFNGAWRWAHSCEFLTMGDCIICPCASSSELWAQQHGLNDLQDLINLAQYLTNNCCAPAVPNPVTCDSLTIVTGGFCTKFKRWCCNGILKKLEFVLYDCEHMDNVILTDTFILNYLGGNIIQADSYAILSDPNNPCALTEHQRRLILDVFLRTQGINPCLNIQE